MKHSVIGRRKGQRGAALVEAVVVIPFFIIIFASMIFIGQLYGEKQRTMREAKQNVWVYAMGNCEGSMSNVSSESDGDPASQMNSQDPNVNTNPTQRVSGSSAGMAKLELVHRLGHADEARHAASDRENPPPPEPAAATGATARRHDDRVRRNGRACVRRGVERGKRGRRMGTSVRPAKTMGRRGCAIRREQRRLKDCAGRCEGGGVFSERDFACRDSRCGFGSAVERRCDGSWRG